MARWRLRDPGSFPFTYHDALREGVGVDKLVIRADTEQAIIGHAEAWRLFLYCLRNHPVHPLHPMAVHYKHRTRRRYNDQLHAWELLLTSRRSVVEDITGFS